MHWILLASLLCDPNAYARDDGAEIHDETAPLWEIGMGGGGTYTPDYPGSDQSHTWGVPFPWAIYRGEILHSDSHGGTRARFFRAINYEFNASVAGGLPSSSSDSDIRQGMPSLEYLGEVGPRVTFDLWTGADRSLLRFGLPVRAAFSDNGPRLRDRGWLFAPELLYDRPHIANSRWSAFFLLTMNFADRRFADYFYEVEPVYARPGRPEYAARAGYLLTDISVGVSTPITGTHLFISAVASLESLAGSANESSPLLKTNWNTSVGAALIWVFASSDRRVRVED